MSDVTIKTNHHWRDFVYRHDVPASVLADRFDWTNEEDHFDGFFCYRGWWYHLSEFSVWTSKLPDDSPFKGWDAYAGDSYFSGVVIKVSRDGERYQIGTYYS
jgi:hypothetical protein